MRNLIVHFLLLCTLHLSAQLIVFTGFDLNAGTGSSDPGDFAIYNGKMYFAADSVGKGTELWVSDGNLTGTKLLVDINPGTGDSYPTNLTVFNGKLYFSANDGTNGTELWVTD